MEHRHLNHQSWSAAAVDSALERGNLHDWKELFAAVRDNREVAALVLRVASERKSDGASILAKALIERMAPGLEGLAVPSMEKQESPL
jgi:hypothetical protein